MTQEEKAKRYDEAIKVARLKIKNDKDHVLYEKDITDIFPELEESDDERIRKAIVSEMTALKEQGKETFATININDCIAWLEKQKEFVSVDFDDVWKVTDCDELTAPLGKYSKDAIKKMCHAWYDKGIELERKSWLEKRGKQKFSEWSKEDEAITLQIEQIIKCVSFLNIVPEKLNKINKWLKSLKQRIKE